MSSSATHCAMLPHGVGNLCIGAGDDPRYARRMVALLVAGLRQP